ncbi:hypothetical protein G9X50_11645 [Cronobacter sakazakii]|uniref:patatin-like phospholipase family protein n=1 Tax=Enterobacteriaceae TaxID=543 RepID=UPI001412D635|nr:MULTISPECIES: patatin-like phospholipase family protein [Enterobacteriaceae]HDM0228251.1 patatin-like phospholipase family protein [Escherichia coli]ELY4080187.1 patatin-like phospholipase family protein [Cronobacter sakazakii]ELY5885881.1 patatin-like phospholipase family protein [Cronobacter sakazakii]MBL5911772.1 patatin-like phospholipase family protein [Enterobacter asburiae]MBL5916862.1 patatin-like phospholipase family protein [Enterobacter asburiae]
MVKLESYAVFEGGGIKGIAFAGALEAAERAGINFVGYAGASAGALVGFLACLGYSGSQIYNAIKHMDFSEFTHGDIQESTLHIKRVLYDIRKVETVNPKRGFITRLLYMAKVFNRVPVFTITKDLWKIYKRLDNKKGLYSKEKLIFTLINLAQTKINLTEYTSANGETYRSITFRDFYNHTKKDFRVIATDVLTGRVIEFSHLKTPDACVIQIVAASSAYPIIFEPTEYDGMYLVDGGLSCNLPSYIFHDSHHKRLPIYAFDLMSDQETNNSLSKYTILDHVKRLVYSSLDASNNIISTVAGGIAVPLRVPAYIDTMNMNISSVDAKKLYRAGNRSASKFFATHDLTRLYTQTPSKHVIGRLLYGRLDGLLNVFLSMLPNPGFTIKAWLYTTIDSSDSELVSFSKVGVIYLNILKIYSTPYSVKYQRIPFVFRLKNIKDYVFQFPKKNGHTNIDCIKAWVSSLPTISYKLDNTRICFPIHRFDSNEVMAVLCISISLPVHICESSLGWVNITKRNGQQKIDISDGFGRMLSEHSLLISSAMYGNQVIFHQSNH